MSLLSISHLYKRFNLEAGFFARYGRFVNAVNDISFSINKNEAYGLVGESGCGKTTTARILVRMYEADSGVILFYNEDKPVVIAGLEKEKLRQYREKVRYVFQDPARSLNPRLSVYEVLVSGCRRPLKQRGVSESELRQKAAAILEEVGLMAADLEKRPSEFSGGQRQRISIARALLMEPEVLICDEVVSALDVSIQGQILNLLLKKKKKRNMSFLFIAHDLKVACYFCDRIGVMYKGELMEEAPAADLYKEGLHPYTKLLFSSASAIPKDDPADVSALSDKKISRRVTRSNTELNEKKLSNKEDSCSFAPRCPRASERCFFELPAFTEIKSGHSIRCFNYAAADLSSANS
jgi:oligopeptide/dipeptide ABC transporter ATP-binding protein